jgi:hypothetical protein
MLIYVCCVLYVFLRFKHWLCWKYQYNLYMFNCICIYSFIPMSGCVGIYMGGALCSWTRGNCTACPCAKTALNTHLSYIPPMSMFKIYRPRWMRWCVCVLDKHVLFMHALQNSHRLALNNNHSLHYLFTKPYFLWFLIICMMFTYLKFRMFVSSTGQSGMHALQNSPKTW